MNGEPAAAAVRTTERDGVERGDVERVRLALLRDVRSGRWREGERLPTERAIAAQFGVARNTVRRALEVLETESLIVRHAGRGTFRSAASAPDTEPFAVAPDALGLADVVECRLLFEPELAPLVVARATTADLDRMGACLIGGEAASDAAGYDHWDARLHDAIAAATHNRTILALARALARGRPPTEWGVVAARSVAAAHRAVLQDQHRGIVAAFRDRDREAARGRLRAHILYVRGALAGG